MSMTATCKLGEKGCWNDGKCRATSNCINKIFTNADRIRAMSDEELANNMVRCFSVCRHCAYRDECEFDRFVTYEKCIEGIFEWLKQPAEDTE